jgi:hypothetical protein
MLALVALASVGTITAQEGFPLKGSWIGVWEGNPQGNDVLLVMNWDGKAVTGMINPGTDNIAIGKAALDPSNWTVTIEADAKDKSGAALHYVIEAKIENLELPNRSLIGTWRNQRGRGDFEASRQ